MSCIETAWSCLGGRGKHGQVGVVPHGLFPELGVQDAITFGKSFIGIMEGHSDPKEFAPTLVKLVGSGQLPMKKIAKLFKVEDFEEAIHGMHDGSVLKPILVF